MLQITQVIMSYLTAVAKANENRSVRANNIVNQTGVEDDIGS